MLVYQRSLRTNKAKTELDHFFKPLNFVVQSLRFHSLLVLILNKHKHDNILPLFPTSDYPNPQ